MSARLLNLVAVCAIGLCLCAQASAAPAGDNEGASSSAGGDKKDLMVELVTANGNVVKIPYYNEELRNIPEEVRKSLTEDLEKMLNVLQTGLLKLIQLKSGEKSSFWAQSKVYGTMSTNLIGLLSEQKKNRDKLKKTGHFVVDSAGYKDSLKGDIAELFKTRGQRVEPQVLANKIEVLFADVNQIVASNPAATYIDWFKGTINGEKVGKVVGEVFGELRSNGFDILMTLLQKASKVMLS